MKQIIKNQNIIASCPKKESEPYNTQKYKNSEDFVRAISEKYHITIEYLEKLNPIIDFKNLKSGELIRVISNTDFHCDHSKQKFPLLISPLDSDCEENARM